MQILKSNGPDSFILALHPNGRLVRLRDGTFILHEQEYPNGMDVTYGRCLASTTLRSSGEKS